MHCGHGAAVANQVAAHGLKVRGVLLDHLAWIALHPCQHCLQRGEIFRDTWRAYQPLQSNKDSVEGTRLWPKHSKRC
jgi:hypothetical protein